jgi:hypothetical protein
MFILSAVEGLSARPLNIELVMSIDEVFYPSIKKRE